ncbi:MAG TPA: hypothetical protein VH234_05750 [Candidatus Saccharimonadales bacterium]|jgi:hypothetical protein|nr:hypothetical protein [Candidatus Saccharimonadales bacterium]
MDAPSITLAGIMLVPLILLMVLRVNAALVFLSLCLGNVLVQFVAKDTSDFLTLHADQVTQKVSSAGSNGIKLGLLLLPVVLTAIFMIRTVKGHGRLALNLLPAAGVGLLGGLLVVPLLPSGLSHNVINSSLWTQVTRAQDLIVGASALVCLLVLWLQRPKTGGKHEKHKR